MKRLGALLRDEQGVTAIEYTLVALMVSTAIVSGVAFLGTWLSGSFSYIGNQVNR